MNVALRHCTSALVLLVFGSLCLSPLAAHAQKTPSTSPGTQPALRPEEIIFGVLTGDQAAEIARLVENLGASDHAVRQQATEQLVKIGFPALSAVREAMQSSDAEVAARAGFVWQTLAESREDAIAIRRQAGATFDQGDYASAVRLFAQLARSPMGTYDDRLWLGHAYQLADDWTRALAAYRWAAEMAQASANVRDDPRGFRYWMPRHQQLLLSVGLRQLEHLNDPQAAIATFKEIIAFVPELNGSAEEVVARLRDQPRPARPQPEQDIFARTMIPLRAMEALARAQEQQGDLRAAAETSILAVYARQAYRGPSVRLEDMREPIRLMMAMGPQETPPCSWFLMLSPERPERTLTPEQATLDNVPVRASTGGQFIVTAPAGQDIDTLEVVLKGEPTDRPRPPGREWSILACTRLDDRRTSFGTLSLPVIAERESFALHDVWSTRGESGPLLVEFYDRAKSIRVHSLTVRATFRAASQTPSGDTGKVQLSWVTLPPGGTRLVDGKPENFNILPPGRHVLSYQFQERPPIRWEGVLLAGPVHSLLLNHDSPMELHLTNLPLTQSDPGPRPLGVARLQDGRWLMAFTSVIKGDSFQRPSSRVMLTTSDDLLTWDEPWPLSVDRTAPCSVSSLVADPEGTIWLAWSSQRLSMAGSDSERLWVSRSADGKTWSTPVTLNPSPQTGQLLWAADGQCWLFSGDKVAWGTSPTTLGPLEVLSAVQQLKYSRPHVQVCLDNQGKMHLIATDYSPGQTRIHYATSDDGRQWSAPVELPISTQEPVRSLMRATCLIANNRLAILYDTGSGTFLRFAPLESPDKIGPPIALAPASTYLSSVAPIVLPDGRTAVVYAGGRYWLLIGDLSK